MGVHSLLQKGVRRAGERVLVVDVSWPCCFALGQQILYQLEGGFLATYPADGRRYLRLVLRMRWKRCYQQPVF